MRRFFLIVLAGTIYSVGISICWADNVPLNYLFPGYSSRTQAVNQDLDQIESSRNNQMAVSTSVLNNQTAAPARNIQTVSSASAIIPKRNEVEFSSESYWAKFDEPKSYSQKGFLSGYNAQYAHRFSTDPGSIINMYSLQAQWADGKFKQPPVEGPSGIKDSTYDVRGVVGKDLYPVSNVRTTPYLGFGYRYLKDNSAGLNTDIVDPILGPTTLQGYLRYSHYYYLPFGTDIVYQTNHNYSLEGNLEYDYMINGVEVDKIGVVPGYDTLVVDQRNGSGFRTSLRLNLYFKYFTAFAEGFYRFWNIPQSSTRSGLTDPDYGLNEPKNNTQEFGMRLGIQI